MVVVSTFEQRRRPVKPGIAAAPGNFFIHPFPDREQVCIMRGPPRSVRRSWRGSGTKKEAEQVLTAPKSAVRCAAHSGTLVNETERGAEAGSQDL